MNRTVKILTAGLAVAALSVGGAAIATADAGTLESEESTSLTFSREEEKLARDLYTAFGEKYDSVVWDRIAASEQRHFDAVGRLLEQYKLSDPSEGKDAGECRPRPRAGAAQGRSGKQQHGAQRTGLAGGMQATVGIRQTPHTQRAEQ